MTTVVSSTDALTVGVSIAVPEPHATTLATWRAEVEDPLADLVAPHITVVPPLSLDAQRLEWTLEHLDRVCRKHSPFKVHLRGTGSFRPVSAVVFVAVADGISACELLAADVRVGALRHPLVFPFHPHVTVAHNVDDERLDRAYDGLSEFEARFTVEEITLHEQHTDGRWSPIRSFRLGGG